MFKYFNHWISLRDNQDVFEGWNSESEVIGNPVFKPVQKLKCVKQSLIAWTKEHSLLNSKNDCMVVKQNLKSIKACLDMDPMKGKLTNQEKEAMNNYYELAKIDEDNAR